MVKKCLKLLFEIIVFVVFLYGIWGTKSLLYSGTNLILRLFLTSVSLHCLIYELEKT